MRAVALALVLAAAAAGCGDARVVLELAGDVPRGDRIDVLLLEPTVLAKQQVHNRNDANTTDRLETVFYMAERSRTTISPIETIAGLQLEIRDPGGPYVPLVAVRAGDQLLALGVHDPQSIFAAPLGREHAAATVAPVSDVTIYPIELEPAEPGIVTASGPRPVEPGQVMAVACGPGEPVSGLVWRRADLRQLRVMAARPDDRGDRLDPPDLDCDQHSPGAAGLRHVPGDELDCDDTAASVHGAGREQCSKLIDNDCRPETTLSPVPCANLQCPTPRCVCDDAGPAEACLEPLFGEVCKLAGSPSSGGLKPCDGAGPMALPVICQAGCEVMLAWAPEGLEVTISDQQGQQGQPLGRFVPIADGRAFLTVRPDGGRAFSGPLEILLRIKVGLDVGDHLMQLTLFDGACEAPSMLVCPNS